MRPQRQPKRQHIREYVQSESSQISCILRLVTCTGVVSSVVCDSTPPNILLTKDNMFQTCAAERRLRVPI